MKFQTTSRRDDLILLFYLLVYMLKGGQIPGHSGYNSDDSIEKDFEIIFKVKFTLKTKDLCFGNTSDFR